MPGTFLVLKDLIGGKTDNVLLPPGIFQEIFLKILNVKFFLTGSVFSTELHIPTLPRN